MRSGVQTFYTSAAKGTGLRGIELDRCYTGPYDEQGRRHGVGTYKFPNHMVYEGNYVHGVKQGAHGSGMHGGSMQAYRQHAHAKCTCDRHRQAQVSGWRVV